MKHYRCPGCGKLVIVDGKRVLHLVPECPLFIRKINEALEGHEAKSVISYCRRGKDSDVYVYSTARGIVCGKCRMIAGDLVLASPLNMLTHLDGHILRGDKVPKEALEQLFGEAGFTKEDP